MSRSTLSTKPWIALFSFIVAAVMINSPLFESSLESGQGELTKQYYKIKSIRDKYTLRTNISNLFIDNPPKDVKNTKVVFDCIFIAPYPNAATEMFTGLIVSDIEGQQQRILLIENRFTVNLLKIKPGTRMITKAITIFKEADSAGKKFGMQLLSSAVSGIADGATSGVNNKYGKQGVAIGENLINSQIAGLASGSKMTVIAIGLKKFQYAQVNRSYFRNHDMAILVENKNDLPQANSSVTLGNLKIYVEPISNASDIFTAQASLIENENNEVMMYPVFMHTGSIPIFSIEILNVGDQIEDFGNVAINFVPNNTNPLSPVNYALFLSEKRVGADASSQKLAKQFEQHLAKQDIVDFDSSFKLIPGYKYKSYIFFDYDMYTGGYKGELVIFCSGKTPNLAKKQYNIVKGNGLKIKAFGKETINWESQFIEKKKPKEKAPVAVRQETRNIPSRPVEKIANRKGQCNDGVDNDKDGWIDIKDPDCVSSTEEDGGFGDYTECNDGVDNDKDGLIDSLDKECGSAFEREK